MGKSCLKQILTYINKVYQLGEKINTLKDKRLKPQIKMLREENLRLLARNAELEAKAKKTAKIVVNHHQLIITKSLSIAARRLVRLQVDKNAMKAKHY